MDYLDHFSLQSEPFANAPVSRFYYHSTQHDEALKRLTYVASGMKGLAVCIGNIGHGKTTLARRLLDHLLEQNYEAALLIIVHEGISATWLLRRIAMQLGVADPGEEKLTIINRLYQRLVEIHEAGRKAVVLIDEAQMLATKEIMEEFRGLLNIELPGHKLLSFVLFGLPELEQHMMLDPPLAQRVALKYRLPPFDEPNSAAYINFRLEQAGATYPIFTPEAITKVHLASGGIPRVINTICDNALLEAFFAGSREVTGEIVDKVTTNLGELTISPEQAAEAEAALKAARAEVQENEALAAAEAIEAVQPEESVAETAAEEFKEESETIQAAEVGIEIAPAAEEVPAAPLHSANFPAAAAVMEDIAGETLPEESTENGPEDDEEPIVAVSREENEAFLAAVTGGTLPSAQEEPAYSAPDIASALSPEAIAASGCLADEVSPDVTTTFEPEVPTAAEELVPDVTTTFEPEAPTAAAEELVPDVTTTFEPEAPTAAAEELVPDVTTTFEPEAPTAAAEELVPDVTTTFEPEVPTAAEELVPDVTTTFEPEAPLPATEIDVTADFAEDAAESTDDGFDVTIDDDGEGENEPEIAVDVTDGLDDSTPIMVPVAPTRELPECEVSADLEDTIELQYQNEPMFAPLPQIDEAPLSKPAPPPAPGPTAKYSSIDLADLDALLANLKTRK